MALCISQRIGSAILLDYKEFCEVLIGEQQDKSLKSYVIFGTYVMTQRGEVLAQDLQIDDKILTDHSGYEAMSGLVFKSVSGLQITKISKGHFNNHRDLILPSMQRIRCDSESTVTSRGKKTILAEAFKLENGGKVINGHAPSIRLMEIRLEVPALVFLSGATVELVDPMRHDSDAILKNCEALDLSDSCETHSNIVYLQTKQKNR